MDGIDLLAARRDAAASSIRTLRTNLLDLTGNNPLISFAHARARGLRMNVRAVDVCLNTLFQQVVDGRTIPLRPLPPPEDEPADEQSGEFKNTLEAARMSDFEFQKAQAELAEDELTSPAAAKIERDLRDRVRAALGMPPRKMAALKSLADHAIAKGINPSFELGVWEDKKGESAKVTTVAFQALMLPDSLQMALAKIRDTARTFAEETGVSTLHVAFGFLEWFESESSEKAMVSPLVVVQVDLERTVVRSRYHYTLASTGDEPQTNLTLSERLYRDFRIRLPELQEEEQLESYLLRVQEDICKGRPRWRIRQFVTLAQFPFARLAMFNDLDQTSWVSGLSDHPLLGRLLGGSEVGEASFAEEHVIDSKEVAEKVPLLVLDADASQHSAVYDVMIGKSLVIEGPPGTGKSQTITNIIAAALAADKRVLFMADKQAALQVVKDRLDHVGLGDFCLELHSGKSKKTEVLESLKRRMERRPASRAEPMSEKLYELENTRKSLDKYVASLNSPLGGFGATVHDILWADRRRRADEGMEARQLDALVIPDSIALTATDIEKRKALLARFELAASPILARSGRVSDHPWFGMTRAGLPAVDIDEALRALEDATVGMERVASTAAGLSNYGLNANDTIEEVERAAQLFVDLPVAADIPSMLFTGLAHEEVRKTVRSWIPRCRAYRSTVERLSHWGIGERFLEWSAVAAEIEDGLKFLLPLAAPGLPVSGVSAWAAGLNADAKRALEVNMAVTRVASILGCGGPKTYGEIDLLLQACLHLRAVNGAMIGAMSSAMVSRESVDVVAAAASEIHALRERAVQLGADYRLQPLPNPSELRQAATTLREAGMLSFLSTKVKQATRTYEELRKSPGPASRPEMAAALVALADHLDAVGGLESNVTYRMTFGTRFHGLKTDLEVASSLAGWAGRVRASLLGGNELGTRIREILLCGDPDRLETLAASTLGVPANDLRNALPHVADTTLSPEQVAADLDRRAHGATTFARVLMGYGVDGSVEVAALPRLRDALMQAAQAKEAATCPASVTIALAGEAPSALADMGPLECALQASAAVADSALPLEVRARLLTMPPAQIAGSIISQAVNLVDAVQATPKLVERARRDLGLDDIQFFGNSFAKAATGAAAARLRLATGDALGEWLTYLIERENVEALRLSGLLALWDDGVLVTPLAMAFDRALHRSLARAALSAHPHLDRHTGLGQEEARARFKSLDAETTELRRRKLADQLARKVATWGNGVGKKSDWTEGALLALEASKQRRHIPIRKLLDRAGNAIQTLKPCFMMSPLSVAQYLAPEGLHFDLLVIDEASQMRPEDALGAIARSDQIVVVGDPKQLPPTAFFAGNDDSANDDDEVDEKIDAESILDLAQSVFRPMRRLRWHYRSRHGSLIDFSNREFYDDDLIVFPSPAEADPTQGVTLVKVDGIYKSRSNILEVETICAAAVDHMRENPTRSLGIATMNGIQRDLIKQRMDQLTALHPEVEAYRLKWGGTLERFFVKNLENVQGDERDVIFISTVFGPPEPGKKVRQNFGPINGASGHRRLNVLFTRAKHHVRVFTSMTPDDIAAGPESPRGARVLKSYLAYAASGRLDAGVDTGRDADSDFEVFVRDRLRLAGYEAVPQVGVSGFFIDLAVRHPDMPGTYLLGVECDGASYHSSRSARDRDILRQQVLEGLGWSIYRIWSTDWFRDPAGQTRKMVAHIEELRSRRSARH